MSTGPLGQGLASAVGFAFAQRFEKGIYKGNEAFDHFVFALCGEACLEEGISQEGASLAGTHKLGNLIVLYDENNITIEGSSDISMNEDILKRYEANGWSTETVNFKTGGECNSYLEDIDALNDAINRAKKITDKPSIIRVQTLIAWPTPELTGKEETHGSPLGATAIQGLKNALGFDPDKSFDVDEDLYEEILKTRENKGNELYNEWKDKFEEWKNSNPIEAGKLEDAKANRIPDISYPDFAGVEKIATRASSGKVLNAIAKSMHNFWGGSADLGTSNKTVIEGVKSFGPPETSNNDWENSYDGKVIHYGIRENGMAAIMNGIALNSNTRTFGGTFAVFSDYMRGTVRLAALSELPVIYVWTHDSIGVGEDGPTHQPIEHLSAYRAIPNLDIVRPADGIETVEVYKKILSRTKSPAGVFLSRQDLPVLEDYRSVITSDNGAQKGGYVIARENNRLDAIILATGSEVSLAIEAKKRLFTEENIDVRVVSMPCFEWFEEQSDDYKQSVLPSEVTKRVSVEAGIAQSWYKYVGTKGKCISIEEYGIVGSDKELFEKYGFTVSNIVDKVRSLNE
jgi:transketolase